MTRATTDARRTTRFPEPAYVHAVGPDVPSAHRVEAGERFTLETLDASGNQIRPGVDRAKIDQCRLFPVSGPVFVAGVQPGSTIGVGIIDIRCASTGHVWTRPGLGFDNPGLFEVRALAIRPPQVLDESGIQLDYRPHTGALGVLPSTNFAARDLGGHGGNLDIPDLGPGAVLWVQATVEGGGVFAGDVHACIADGEVCGTGVETSAEVDLAVIPVVWHASHPVVMTPDRTWLVGIGNDVEAAIADVLPTVTAALARARDLTEAQAYLMTSLLLDIRVCQLVNPHTSVAVSLRNGLDRHLVPDQAHQDFLDFSESTMKKGN